MPEPYYTKRGATFSPCKKYRYTLLRKWSSLSSKPGFVLFVMLNPSVADENQLDPTIRRCLGYTMAWDFCEMHVCNLFALRSTDPKQLYSCDDPIGPDNDKCIYTEVAGADLVIAAWGSHGVYKDRGKQVMDMITKIKVIHYLKLTKSGVPGHPLYLKGDLIPVPVILK